MNQYELTATDRTNVGKGASRRLRRLSNQIPAILYGADEPAKPLSLNHFQVSKALQHEGFYSHILTLDINGTKQQAVLKDIQRHPYKPQIQHMDFLRITGKEKIRMQVPLHFKGDDKAPGLKEGGIISHVISSVEVICFPKDLPEFIEVDTSGLNIDDTLHLSNLALPEGIELAALSHGHHDDKIVVSMHVPKAEEVPIEAPATAEVPAINQAEPAAGTEALGSEKKK